MLHTEFEYSGLGIIHTEHSSLLYWRTRVGFLRGKEQVMSTYTDADGIAELQLSHDPGVVEQVRHWLVVNSPVAVPL